LDGIDGDDTNLQIRGLTDPPAWTYRGRIPRFTFQEATVFKAIEGAVEANKPLHLVPSAANFPALDSIVYLPTEGPTCIQTTMKSKHPIAVSSRAYSKMAQTWIKACGSPPYKGKAVALHIYCATRNSG
jgi:hypothetical protein